MTPQERCRTQDGLITRRQAREAGLTSRMIEHRLARGDWTSVRPGVYLSAEHEYTDRARVRADMLWLGSEATLTGVGGAWWWRMIDRPPRTVRVAVPPRRRVRPSAGTVAERRDLSGIVRVDLDGIAVTTKALTVVDAVRELGVVEGAELMDRALVRGRVDVDGLRDAYRFVLGRRGAAAVGTLLPLAAGGARFAAERRLHRLLRDAGISGWVANDPVALPGFGTPVLDVAFRAQHVVVEVDGWAYHRDLDAFRRDQRRQNALVLAGWTVLRVSWHDLVTDPARVLVEIRNALGRRDVVGRDHGERSVRPAV